MKRTILSIGIACTLLYACTSGNRSGEQVVANDSIAEQVDTQPVLSHTQNTGIVRLSLDDGEGRTEMHKESNQTVYIEFEAKGYKKIMAHLTSKDSLANIRFSQITLPDGSMDGPFGRDLTYNIKSDGIYKVSIHENMMAGDPWGGFFNVEVKLLK